MGCASTLPASGVSEAAVGRPIGLAGIWRCVADVGDGIGVVGVGGGDIGKASVFARVRRAGIGGRGRVFGGRVHVARVGRCDVGAEAGIDGERALGRERAGGRPEQEEQHA